MGKFREMTNERASAISDWLNINCRYCINNADYGTDFVNCQTDCEVKKNIGIACVHYEEYIDEDVYR